MHTGRLHSFLVLCASLRASQSLYVLIQGLLVSPKMTEDHYTTSLLRSLKAVSERLAEQEGKQGNKETQGSSQVAAADRGAEGKHETNEGHQKSGGMKEATLGGIFDLV